MNMFNTVIRITWKEILALGIAIGTAGAELILAKKISNEEAPKCFNTLVSKKQTIESSSENDKEENVIDVESDVIE